MSVKKAALFSRYTTSVLTHSWMVEEPTHPSVSCLGSPQWKRTYRQLPVQLHSREAAAKQALILPARIHKRSGTRHGHPTWLR